MDGPCILGMASSSLKSPIQLLGVALGNVVHQPKRGANVPPAIDQGEIIWQDIENLQFPTQV